MCWELYHWCSGLNWLCCQRSFLVLLRDDMWLKQVGHTQGKHPIQLSCRSSPNDHCLLWIVQIVFLTGFGSSLFMFVICLFKPVFHTFILEVAPTVNFIISRLDHLFCRSLAEFFASHCLIWCSVIINLPKTLLLLIDYSSNSFTYILLFLPSLSFFGFFFPSELILVHLFLISYAFMLFYHLNSPLTDCFTFF